MLNILFGPPGSGKTTAVQEIQAHGSLTYISVGAIYRSEVEKNTDFSRVLRHYVESNTKYPQDIIRRIVEPNFKKIKKDETIILDGFPRHEHELKILHDLLQAYPDATPGNIMILTLSEEAARKRIIKRRVCSLCDYTGQIRTCPKCGNLMEKRHDDDRDQFHKRFRVYMANSALLISQLANMGFKPIYINSEREKGVVYNEILKELFYSQKKPMHPITSHAI